MNKLERALMLEHRARHLRGIAPLALATENWDRLRGEADRLEEQAKQLKQEHEQGKKQA